MKPTDLRNLTWSEVLTHLTEDLVRVHLAWQAHGPGTTRQIAQQARISLLTLRPRTTDLYKLGLVVLVTNEGGEGVYAARTREEAELSRAWQQRADFRADVSRRMARENVGHVPGGQQAATGRATITPVGFITVEAAIASLTEADRAALGARLMSQYGHHLKRRQPGPGQLDLLPA